MASTPSPRVTFFHAQQCSLCEKARAVLDAVGEPYEAVDITGVEELEARYREWLPVVEIDGERAFVYFLDEAQLRRKLSRT
ncbi:MAG TPA: glutaredoxin family protein [Gaiellaceae bacterium]|nr:glutaredoxin family protein [Gaiellaceae bacterium]